MKGKPIKWKPAKGGHVKVKAAGQASNKNGGKVLTIVILTLLILLCLVAIAFLTYALLLKGGENDGKIGINVTSGECKIDIVDMNDDSLVGDVLDFVTADGQEKIYFQPGSIYYTEGFEVKNTGTIPVNFRVSISEDEDVDLEEFKEAFEFWITTDPENLDAAENLTSFSGKLNSGDKSVTYYLVVKMKETAGNEFQNKTYTGIGITVYAVSGNGSLD